MTALNRTEVYCCPYCTQTYKRKGYFDRHVLCCKIGSTAIKCTDEADDIPTVKELYTIIQELTKRYATQQQELNTLKRWVNDKKKKINVIVWLNKNCKLETNYFQWLDSVVIQRKHIELIFEYNYIEGFLHIFQDLFPLDNATRLPIKSFEQKKGTLFIYDNENKWRMLESKEFENLINILSKKLIKEFQQWTSDHEHELYTDDFATIYSENVIKIMGNNMSFDVIKSRTNNKLYNHLKHNLKHIIEYEFTL